MTKIENPIAIDRLSGQRFGEPKEQQTKDPTRSLNPIQGLKDFINRQSRESEEAITRLFPWLTLDDLTEIAGNAGLLVSIKPEITSKGGDNLLVVSTIGDAYELQELCPGIYDPACNLLYYCNRKEFDQLKNARITRGRVWNSEGH